MASFLVLAISPPPFLRPGQISCALIENLQIDERHRWLVGRAVRGDRYDFTRHALDEMDDDELTENDVSQALLHGRVVAELTDDPRCTRYVVRRTRRLQGDQIEVICRFLPSGYLRVITVYTLAG